MSSEWRPNAVFHGLPNPKYAGYRTGESKWYHENGIIKKKQFFVNGLIDGFGYHYFPSGKVRIKTMYKRHVPDGLMEIFWENGNIRERGLKGAGNGRRIGTWEIFDEEGNKTSFTYCTCLRIMCNCEHD